MVRLAGKRLVDCVPRFWTQPIRLALQDGVRCHESGCSEGDVLPDRQRLAERQLPASGLCRPSEKRCQMVAGIKRNRDHQNPWGAFFFLAWDDHILLHFLGADMRHQPKPPTMVAVICCDGSLKSQDRAIFQGVW